VLDVIRTLRWHHARPAAGRGTGERELLAGTAAALAVVLGQGLLDYPLRNPVIATTVWLLVGLFAGAVSGDRQMGIGRPGAALRQIRRVVLAGSADRRGARM
jgi:hypothetical protein